MLNVKAHLIVIHEIFLSKVIQLFLEHGHVKELDCFLFRHKQRTVYTNQPFNRIGVQGAQGVGVSLVRGQWKCAKLNSGNSHAALWIHGNLWIVHFKCMNFQLYELYLNLKNSGQPQVNERKYYVCVSEQWGWRKMYVQQTRTAGTNLNENTT